MGAKGDGNAWLDVHQLLTGVSVQPGLACAVVGALREELQTHSLSLSEWKRRKTPA
ncbi:hypothetical protein DsansV1_C08g0078511 [Dioscorea sansibarensis]